MATQPLESTAVTTIDSLKDDNVEEILLRLPSSASLTRAALASNRWRRIASSPDFLRRFRTRHPSSPLLGLFVSDGDSGLPDFHLADPVRSDPDLAAAARGGDFLLTRLERDPAWRLLDCRNGRLLLSRGKSLSIYDPISHRHVTVCRPQNDSFPFPEYIADCLLDGRGEDGATSFRVVTVQRHGQRMRAVEYHSCTPEWRFHPWADNIKLRLWRMQAMHAAGLIFWRSDKNWSLLLDTSTTEFSMLPPPTSLSNLPSRPPRYAIGEIQDDVCCLVCNAGNSMLQVCESMLQVWLLKKNGGRNMWELEKQRTTSVLIGTRRQVHMVVNGLALVYRDERRARYSYFAIDLKDLSVKGDFLCHGLAYPFQMPWPPAGLAVTSKRPTPQIYACKDTEKQQEAPSSSRKRKSKDEMSSGKEKMGPNISMISLNNESSQKKSAYESGPSS